MLIKKKGKIFSRLDVGVGSFRNGEYDVTVNPSVWCTVEDSHGFGVQSHIIRIFRNIVPAGVGEPFFLAPHFLANTQFGAKILLAKHFLAPHFLAPKILTLAPNFF